MLPGALVMLVAGPFAGVLVRRFGGKVPLSLGAFVSAAGLLLMALDHGTQAAMVAWNIVLSLGIGLAFAAMPNLIFDAVPQSETGEATGFNTLVRSVGASLGSQIAAAILTASVAVGAVLPSGDGYTAAFLVSACVATVAAIVALLIPRVRTPEPRPGRAPRRRGWRTPSDERAPPAPAPTPSATTSGVIAAASEVLAEKGVDGARARDRRAGRRRQGHRLPLLPDQGPPDLGGGRRAAALVHRSRPRGGAAARRLGGVRGAAVRLRRAPGRRLHVLGRALARVGAARGRPGARGDARRDRRADGPRAGRGQDAPGRDSRDVKVLFAGVAQVLRADGNRDPAEWRRYAALVADAMRA